MPDPDRALQTRLLAVIALVLVTAALRASYPVTMPLAVAAVVIAAIWPLQERLSRSMPTPLAYAATITVLLAGGLGFLAAIFVSAVQVVQALGRDWGRLATGLQQLSRWAERWGVSFSGEDTYTRLIGLAQAVLGNAYTILVYGGFIALIVILGLPEVPRLKEALRGELDRRERRDVMAALEASAGRIRSYLAVTLMTSLLTGAVSALWAVVVGLDLALVWGILNFLLNFVPVVGNLVGIVPPTLYAMLQFQDWTWTLIVFAGLAVAQIAISNFVYPMLQGRSLSLSPVAIVLALAFWSWVWGIAGALIAVPLTAVVVIACEHIPRLRWFARLLARSPDDAAP